MQMLVVPRRDYIVGFIADETIIAAAEQWRTLGAPAHSLTFDITIFITSVLKAKAARPLKIIVRDHGETEDLAYVTYDLNPILNCDRQLWNDARFGEPRSRYMLAHECCHILFHSHNAKAFSNPEELHLKSALDQQRPEHHANLFADYFLITDRNVKSIRDANEIARQCDVELSVAERRIEQYAKSYLRSLSSTGEYCPNCSSQLYRRGIRTFCKARHCLYEAV